MSVIKQKSSFQVSSKAQIWEQKASGSDRDLTARVPAGWEEGKAKEEFFASILRSLRRKAVQAAAWADTYLNGRTGPCFFTCPI